MHKISFTAIALCLVMNCVSTSRIPREPVRMEGVRPVSLYDSPLTEEMNRAVVKVFRSGAFVSTGTFISENGLLLTSYPGIAPYIASSSSSGNLIFEKGYSASSDAEALNLQGMQLLLGLDQRDVTERIREGITDSLTNAEIYPMIEQHKQDLVQEISSQGDDIFAEVTDLYSGNVHILTVYKVITDVRLIFAPPVGISADDLANTTRIQEEIRNEFMILRAFDHEGNPFKPESYSALSEVYPSPSDSLTALGYPGQSFRLDDHEITDFYYHNTNPYILNSYRIYLDKEDSLASLSTEYALSSFGNRLYAGENIRYYSEIQQAIFRDSLLSKKESQEQLFMKKNEDDTLNYPKYQNAFRSIDQAVSIARQTGDIYFTLSMLVQLSLLDDLSNAFRVYAERSPALDASGKVQLRTRVLQIQEQILDRIDISAEMRLLKDFMHLMHTVPGEQQPLYVYDLFQRDTSIQNFIGAQANSSFLFDPARAAGVLETESFYDDELFNLMDELAITLEFADNNYQQHYIYLVPAQMLLTRARMDQQPELLPDAARLLSFNTGSLTGTSSPEDPLFTAAIDFTARASGTPVFDTGGRIKGMITSEMTRAVSGNYYYDPERIFVQVLSAQYIRNAISSYNGTERTASELGF